MPGPIDRFEAVTAALPLLVGQELADRLEPTYVLYRRSPRGSRVRIGILNLLECLTDTQRCLRYLDMQPMLVHPFIQARADVESPLTIFHFTACFSMQLPLLNDMLDSLYRLRRFFGTYTALSGAIQDLFTLGMFPILKLPNAAGLDRVCGMLSTRMTRYLTSCQRAAQAMRAYTAVAASGGDLHCGAAPLIFSYGAQRLVWKPRCMDAEHKLHTAIAVFNSFLPVPFRIPELQSMQFYPTGPDRSGYIEFAVHADSMTGTEAAAYAVKLGALIYFTKAMGCGDLHRENIMATIDGPALIDAEFCFLPEMICKPHPMSTGIDHTIGDGLAPNENCNFLVDGLSFSSVVSTTYRAQVDLGFTTAAQVFASGIPPTAAYAALRAAYMTGIHGAIRPRFTPMATGLFQTMIVNSLEEEPRKRLRDAHDMAQLILQFLIDADLGLAPPNVIPPGVDAAIETRLLTDFDLGEVPLFQLEENGAALWQIRMDDTLLFSFTASPSILSGADFDVNLHNMATLNSPF